MQSNSGVSFRVGANGNFYAYTDAKNNNKHFECLIPKIATTPNGYDDPDLKHIPQVESGNATFLISYWWLLFENKLVVLVMESLLSFFIPMHMGLWHLHAYILNETFVLF